jgi:hypothetical protein
LVPLGHISIVVVETDEALLRGKAGADTAVGPGAANLLGDGTKTSLAIWRRFPGSDDK